ncbi:tyrosine-type recombinase/integrase [Streptomyces sp. NPDC048415]|uniref:tyrosine-type recombinase/integrase n=1 Tax=Streptomyces sp. NPDC048415 TaxID=3154822 RepID=UPI0034126D45
MPPARLLFQRCVAAEPQRIARERVSALLDNALSRTGLVAQADGTPLHYTPHDFRRIFITDAILNGLPRHIAQVIAGHQVISVTIEYKAVYPEETPGPTWPSSPAADPCVPARNTGPPPTPSGRSSSATSSAERSPPGSADALSRPRVFI